MSGFVKWAFILFNIFMLIAVLVALNGVGDALDDTASRIGRARIAWGTRVGLTRILFFWVLIDAILGGLLLFTRRGK